MWRIFRFLGRFGNFLLFLLLELVALIIIVSANQKQRTISEGMLLEMSGSMSEARSSAFSYLNLGTENENLKEHLAALQSQVLLLKDSLNTVLHRRPQSLNYMVVPDSIAKDSCLLMDFTKLELPDSLMPVSKYKFIPAEAVNNSVNLNYNYITINKGRNQGVVMDMGVLSPDGIAGQVVNVSANYSLALSVLNDKFLTGAKLLHNSNVGTIRWSGTNPRFATLKFIPQTSQINVGDTVVTSGYSTVFPKDYMIGRVSEFNIQTQDGFYDITVELATNFRGLHHIFLVQHSHQAEIDSIEQNKPAQ
ncbi:MAG: rod shape-determining protein MreC [Bacteroidota bacterium]|jgi:rod shape-determining protein MreC